MSRRVSGVIPDPNTLPANVVPFRRRPAPDVLVQARTSSQDDEATIRSLIREINGMLDARDAANGRAG